MKQFSAVITNLGLALSMALSNCTSIKSSQSLKDAAILWGKSMELKKADLITSAFDTNIVAVYHSNPVVYGKEANNKIWQIQFNDSLDQHPITIEKN